MEHRNTINTIKQGLGSARLMAVSKTRSIEEILSVFNCGVTLFGENRVQEVVAKFSAPRPEGMELHLIGHLQSNKVAKVVPLVDMIESVDSVEILSKINACSEKIGKTMPVLLEFNTSGEESKSGFEKVEDLFNALDCAKELKNVKVSGLMTVGPLGGTEEEVRKAFKLLKTLQKQCLNRYPDFDFSILSMGMSHDWKLAVEEGSTLVRIGTAIFGERNYV